jgi:phage-related protein
LDPWDQLTVATNNLKLAGAELASTLLDALQPVIESHVEKVKEFTNWFKNLSDGQKQMIIRIGAVVAAIGPALIAIGKVTSGVGTFLTTIPKITGVLAKLVPGISGAATAATGAGTAAAGAGTAVAGAGASIAAVAAPILAIVAVIAVLVAAFKHLWDTNEEFRNAITGIWDNIKAKFQEFADGISERLNAVGINFDSVTSAIKAVWEGFCDFLAPIFEGTFKVIETVLSTVLDVLTGLLDVFIGLFTGNWEQCWNGVKEIFQGVMNGIAGIFNALADTLKSVLDVVLGWFGTSCEDIKNVFATIPEWFGQIFTNAYNAVTNAFTAIGQWFSARWTDIQGAFSNTASWFSTTFNNAVTSIHNAFNGIGSWFQTNVIDAIRGVFDGFSLKEAGERIMNSFVNAIKSIHIPTLHVDWDMDEKTIAGLTVKVPVPHISWNAAGGIFNAPGIAGFYNGQLQGVGEKGPEAVLPLDQFYKRVEGYIDRAINETRAAAAGSRTAATTAGGGFTQNNYYTSPKALSPYEAARQTRNATRNMILQLQRG